MCMFPRPPIPSAQPSRIVVRARLQTTLKATRNVPATLAQQLLMLRLVAKRLDTPARESPICSRSVCKRGTIRRSLSLTSNHYPCAPFDNRGFSHHRALSAPGTTSYTYMYIYIYIYIYIPSTCMYISILICIYVLHIYHIYIYPPNKDSGQGRGSYFSCIVIPLDSRIAGRQPRCLSLGA